MKNVEKNVENYTIDEFECAIGIQEYNEDYINALYEKMQAPASEPDERPLNLISCNFI